MDMGMKIEAGTKALHEGDGAALAGFRGHEHDDAARKKSHG
jgi:hypothetical protein